MMMTNEQAIYLLKGMRGKAIQSESEALNMAIEALSCSEEPNRSDLVKESSDLVKDLVNDCISRQDAIDAFEPDHRRDWYTPEIIETLEALPSAQTYKETDGLHSSTVSRIYDRGWEDGQKALIEEIWEDERDRLD